jgi:hypothetical protein
MYYNYASKPYAKQISNTILESPEYYSNKDLVPIQIKNNIKKTLKTICKNIGYTHKQINLDALEVLLNEFYGKIFYSIDHKKEVSKEYYNKYIEGFQFTKTEALLLKKKHPLIFKRINPYRFGLLILKKSNLFKLHVRHFNFKNKAFNKASQWIININSSQRLYDNYDKVLELIKNSLRSFLKRINLIYKINNLKKIKNFNYNYYIVHLFKDSNESFYTSNNENWSPG